MIELLAQTDVYDPPFWNSARVVVAIVLTLVLAGAGLMWLIGRRQTGWNRQKYLHAYLCYVILVFGAIIMALPFYYMLITSVKTLQAANSSPLAWPEQFLWGNYVDAWNLAQKRPKVTFTRYFWISISTSLAVTIAALITSVMAAYAFAKMRFFGRESFFIVMLAMLMVPGQVLLVPNYVILSTLGWLDTYMALIAPWTASVFAIFLLRQFIVTIPDDLWDAAQIDGSNRFRFLWTVIVPLSTPAIITAGIFIFLGNWNSLLWPLIVTDSAEMRTVQVGLQAFEQASGTKYPQLMAASTIVVAPVIFVFFFLQRYFIQGIARAGLK